MADKLTPEKRSENMRRIKGKDTKPELVVRRFLHSRGLRYRVHRKDLPGKPDLVLSGRNAVVFVHGCFWHGCPKCVDGTRSVKSNKNYWSKKIATNKSRDEKNRQRLEEMGWRVFTIWACEVPERDRLEALADKLLALPRRRQR